MALSDFINPGGALLGNVIGAGANIAMNAANNRFNAQQSELNRQYQTAEREAAQEWNLDMWNMQNQYNTPVAQLDRLLAAGINPETAVGMLSENGNTAGQLSTSGQAGSQASAAGMAQPGDLISGAVMNAAQIANINAQTDKTKAEAGMVVRLGEAQIKDLEASAYSKVKAGELSEANAKQIVEMLPLLKDKTTTETSQMNKNIDVLDKQLQKLDAEVRNIDENTNLLGEQKRGVSLDNARKQFLKDFRDKTGIDLEINNNVAVIAEIMGADTVGDFVKTARQFLEGLGKALGFVEQESGDIDDYGILNGLFDKESREKTGLSADEQLGETIVRHLLGKDWLDNYYEHQRDRYEKRYQKKYGNKSN